MEPFLIKDCALAVISTGISAASIIEFKAAIAHIPASSLYYHFWNRLFWNFFIYPEFHNDFADWAYRYLHDPVLSERLGIINPTEYSNTENLRNDVLEIFEQRIDEMEAIQWSIRENKFHFLRSEIIIFETDKKMTHPSELKTVFPTMSLSSIFYHFIDARIRTFNGKDDFSSWLEEGREYGELLNKIQHIDPYFLPLAEQKQKLIDIFHGYF